MENEFKYEIKDKTLIIEKCPNDILTRDLINKVLDNNERINKIHICDGIKEIKDETFMGRAFLVDIKLPNTLKKIGESAFYDCRSLNQVSLPQNLNYMGYGIFNNCESLEEITIPEGIEELHHTFYGCINLKSITLPKTLKNIGNETFYGCCSLKNIEFNDGLETIGKAAFNGCVYLENLKFPRSLKVIGPSAFTETRIKNLIIPDNVEKIENSAFLGCHKLEQIKLGKGIRRVNDNTFKSCEKLELVEFEENVDVIGEFAFAHCRSLEDIALPSNLKKIERGAFYNCIELKHVEIPEGLVEIKDQAFLNCLKLEKINLPSTLDLFGKSVFENCSNLYGITLIIEGKEKEVFVLHGNIINNLTRKLLIYNPIKNKYSFYNEGKYIEIDENIILNNKLIKNMIDKNDITAEDYIKLYYWLNKKFIPSHIIIKNMPVKDIDNFFINKNYIEWGKLLKEYHIYFDENKISFFKLCYVLGVFSKSTSIRDNAIKFLKQNIVCHRNEDWIHRRFDGFDLSNGFNEEYAEFFIKYYDGKNFMTIKQEFGPEIDLMAASYNNFKQVKKVYPNKTLHTNREADLLLPEHVMDAIRTISYEDVDEGNEEFAKVIGRYGYTQEQFEELQNWYNKGKSLTNFSLFVGEDKETESITYKLLSKNDPLNAVLGNITNCCQVLAGAGSSCVEYGMTKSNSGFITFNYKDKIIGQAWVWYDEESKTVCLDNIEVPHRYLEKINQNKTIQKNFIDCLLRIEKSFKEEMNNRGLEVNKVTIGAGYNDLRQILDTNFQMLKYHNFLSGYGGYTDASSQYEIKKTKRLLK